MRTLLQNFTLDKIPYRLFISEKMKYICIICVWISTYLICIYIQSTCSDKISLEPKFHADCFFIAQRMKCNISVYEYQLIL